MSQFAHPQCSAPGVAAESVFQRAYVRPGETFQDAVSCVAEAQELAEAINTEGYRKGLADYRKGKLLEENAYPPEDVNHARWRVGWKMAYSNFLRAQEEGDMVHCSDYLNDRS